MHENSRLLFSHCAAKYFAPGQKVLEVGPDAYPSTYQALIGARAAAWHTIDLADDSRLTFRSTSEYTFPVPDGIYDIVLAGQVIEHVRKPWLWIKEVARVCRPGGLAITISPVSWPYHEAPIDCWRAYPEGMKALFEEAGLHVLHCQWQSLEAPGYRAYRPGVSAACQPRTWRWRLLRSLEALLGLPVERAYDTITIGRKASIGSQGRESQSGA
jgi:SAM-dependent methyltransferase